MSLCKSLCEWVCVCVCVCVCAYVCIMCTHIHCTCTMLFMCVYACVCVYCVYTRSSHIPCCSFLRHASRRPHIRILFSSCLVAAFENIAVAASRNIFLSSPGTLWWSKSLLHFLSLETLLQTACLQTSYLSSGTFCICVICVGIFFGFPRSQICCFFSCWWIHVFVKRQMLMFCSQDFGLIWWKSVHERLTSTCAAQRFPRDDANHAVNGTYVPYLSPTVMKLSALKVFWNIDGPEPRKGWTYNPGCGCNSLFLPMVMWWVCRK